MSTRCVPTSVPSTVTVTFTAAQAAFEETIHTITSSPGDGAAQHLSRHPILMNTRRHVMRTSTPTRRLVVPAVVALVALVVTAGTVAAFNPQPEPPGRWVLSVVDEQAMSLSAVNLADRGDCRARFAYTDANGRTLASQELAVAPGTFATLDFFPPDPIIPPDPIRLGVRGIVTPLTPACALATTLEVFDTATGETTAALGDLTIIEDGGPRGR
jgi:hypothetical protein